LIYQKYMEKMIILRRFYHFLTEKTCQYLYTCFNLHTLFELCPHKIKYEVGTSLGLG